MRPTVGGNLTEEKALRRNVSLPMLLVLLLIVVGCGDNGPDDSLDPAEQPRVEELETEIAQLRDRVDELEQQNEVLEGELTRMGETSSDDDANDEANDDVNDDANDEANDDDENDDDAAAPIEWPNEVAREWTAKGLIDQLRLHLRDPEAEADMPEGWEPGMTAWVPFEVPDEVQGAHDTPGEVMAGLARGVDAAMLGYDQWEVTIRVLLDDDDPDLAYGALLGWGFLDDSVVGRDIRITLTRTDDGRWQPGGAEQRQHCRRGVSADQTLCI